MPLRCASRPRTPRSAGRFPGHPAGAHQRRLQQPRIVQPAAALGGAHVHPQPQRRARARGADRPQDHPPVPPHRRRHHGELPEHVGTRQPQVQRDQPAQRGAAQPRGGCVDARAIHRVDERLQLLDDEPPVVVGPAAAQPGVRGGGVLVNPLGTRVGDADDDEGRERTRLDERVGRLAHAPVLPRDVRGVRVEQVLAVVHVEHGQRLVPLVVAGRQVDHDVAVVWQERRRELRIAEEPRRRRCDVFGQRASV
jgi:hypothetical protein